MLHYDNKPGHMSLSNHQFLTGKSVPMLLQPAYSSNLSPCDFWLFPIFKETINRKRSDKTEDIISNTTDRLQMIPKEGFQKCFQQWQEHWNKRACVRVCVCVFFFLVL
jgi:hypothetical protein